MKNITEELNEDQKEAVLSENKRIILIAGPGSGKTRTIVAKTAHIINQGTEPRKILLLTFTNKAANEMKRRIEEQVGLKAREIFAGTFHSFANINLKQKSSSKDQYSILDDEEAGRIISKIIEEEFGKENKITSSSVLGIISLSRIRKMTIWEILEMPELFHFRNEAENFDRIAKKYSEEKIKIKVKDFDDLLIDFLKMLEEKQEIREELQNRYSHIFVDEFQDTDKIQAQIIENLISPTNSVMVVGDDLQSIYSFRGAQYRNMFDFKEKHNPQLIILKKNYRSTKKIVELINQIITKNKEKFEKELFSTLEEGNKPKLVILNGKREEAYFVKEKIKEVLGQNSKEKVAVLFRSSYQASDLELELAQEGIEYEMRGGLKFFEKKHIRDILALLKMINNPLDWISIERVLLLFPKVGKITARKASSMTKDNTELILKLKKGRDGEKMAAEILEKLISPQNDSPAYLIDQFLGNFYRKYMQEHFEDHPERLEEAETLLNLAVKYPNVREMLDSISLDSTVEKEKEVRVILSTIHQAKGLEWDNVFVISLANGLFPSNRASDIEEERRLFYVACSRAKNELYLCYPQSSGRFYSERFMEPSLFISELNEEMFEKVFGQ